MCSQEQDKVRCCVSASVLAVPAAGGSGGSGVPAARVVEGLDLSARQGFILEQRWQLSLLENVVSGNGIVLRLCMENV